MNRDSVTGFYSMLQEPARQGSGLASQFGPGYVPINPLLFLSQDGTGGPAFGSIQNSLRDGLRHDLSLLLGARLSDWL